MLQAAGQKPVILAAEFQTETAVTLHAAEELD